MQVLSKRLTIVDPHFDQTLDSGGFRLVEKEKKCDDGKSLHAEIARLKDRNRHLKEMNDALERDLSKVSTNSKPEISPKVYGKSKQEFEDLQANYRQHEKFMELKFHIFSLDNFDCFLYKTAIKKNVKYSG